MITSRAVSRILPCVIALSCIASGARANTPEALYGLGARANGMGGAGTAVSNDFASIYYNPAGLGYCGRSEVGFDLRHAQTNVHVRSTNTDIPPPEPTPSGTRMTIGACFRLPYRLSFGLMFGTGLQSSAEIDQTTVNDTPQFLLYGDAQKQLTIAMALAYRPVRQLSIGIGAAIIVNSDLDIGVFAPIGISTGPGEFEELAFDLHWSLSPTAAPYIGITVQPIPQMRLAMTYRGPLKHHLNIPVATTAMVGDLLPGVPPIKLDLPLVVTADTWFQPRELALGVSIDPVPNVTITADLTWYNYAAYNNSPYPFLGIGWDSSSKSFLPAIIGVPTADPIGFRDVWQPRIGVEGRLLDSRLAVRGGLSIRRASVAIPVERNTNLLDNSVTSISAGAGYTFGPRTQAEITARAEARRARERAATQTTDAEDEAPRVAFGDERADLDEAADSMPVTLRLDSYLRVDLMRERHDTHKDVRYGGQVYEIGITSSVGWY